MAVLSFPKTRPKLPAGLMCRLTFRTAVFRQANGSIDSLVIVYDIPTSDFESVMDGFRERGDFQVPPEEGGPTMWIPWPVACVEVELLTPQTKADPDSGTTQPQS